MDRDRRALVLSHGLSALGLCLGGLFAVSNIDAFGHLAQGRQIARLGHVPKIDHFSYLHTTPQPWTNYEWLSDWLFWSLYEAGGFDALIGLKLGLLVCTSVLLVSTAHRAGGSRAALVCASLLLWAVPTVRFRLTIRPHLFGLLLGALYLWALPRLLAACRDGRRGRVAAWLASLTAVHVLWVNLYGSHLLGLSFTALFALASVRDPRARGPLALLVVLQLAASCVSPFGPAIVIDAAAHLLDPAYRELVSEWAPWSSTRPLWIGLGLALHGAAGLLAAVALLRAGQSRDARLWVLVLLAVMAARSIRFTAEYVLLSAPLVATGLALWARSWRPRMLGATCAVAIAGALVAGPLLARDLPPHQPIGHGSDLLSRPAGSALWLQRHMPRARVFASASDSWHLLFGAPSVRVFIDGRLPFYGPDHIRRVMRAFASPPELRQLLHQSRTDAVVLMHSEVEHQAALTALLADPRWSLVLIEQRYALFVKGAGDQALKALAPGFDPQAVLGPLVDRDQILQDVASLPTHPNVDTFRQWVKGLLQLDPLLRPEGAGPRHLRDPVELRRARQAHKRLALVASRLPFVPMVHAYAAMAAVSACDLPEAERLVAAGRREEDNREFALLTQEIALLRGQTASVEAYVKRVEAVPELSRDRWVRALRIQLRDPPRCH